MNMSQSLRLLAGIMVLLTIVLAAFASIYWLWLGAFIALNLIQSAYTNTCPAVWILRKIGVRGEP